jgi:acetyltransferase-like isoleucine patch superfamily enzyme
MFKKTIRLLSKIKQIISKLFLSDEQYVKSLGVNIGQECRFFGDNQFGSEPYLIKLGNRVSLTSVSFVNHDGGVWVLREKYPMIDVVKPIMIGNNVFIGISSVIMPGVKVGDNVIIGAGSIVTKDVQSNTIVAGIPAKFIKKLKDYENEILTISINTKHLSPSKKRKFLREKINMELD